MKSVAFLLKPGTLAHAHSGANSYVFVFVGKDRMWGTVQMLTRDLATVLAGFDPEHPDIEMAIDYASGRFSLGPIEGTPWPVRFGEATFLEDNGTYLILHFDVDRAAVAPPANVRIRFDGVLHAIPRHEVVATVHHEVGLGDLRIRTTDRYTLTHDAAEVTAPLRRLDSIDHVVGASKALVSRVVRVARRLRRRSG